MTKEGAYALSHFQGLGDPLYFSEMRAHSRIIALEPADGHSDRGRPPPTDDIGAWMGTATGSTRQYPGARSKEPSMACGILMCGDGGRWRSFRLRFPHDLVDQEPHHALLLTQ